MEESGHGFKKGDKARPITDIAYAHLGWPAGSTQMLMGEKETFVCKKGTVGVIEQVSHCGTLFSWDCSGCGLSFRYAWIPPKDLEKI